MCHVVKHHLKPYYVNDIIWPEFLDRRTRSRMIWESLNKAKFEEQVLEWFENHWTKVCPLASR
jgi:uncharacterized protein YbdZ (MbtH family)